jgi:hypothetical protein
METSEKGISEMLLRLPIAFDWVKYKGETVFAGVNWEATKKAKKPMMDIFYCATAALNNRVLYTVQWDKNKFQPTENHPWHNSLIKAAPCNDAPVSDTTMPPPAQ